MAHWSENLIPIMVKGNSATYSNKPEGYLGASDSNGGIGVTGICDRDVNTYWETCDSTGYIGYIFTTKKIISKYSMVQYGYWAGQTYIGVSWCIEGSNDTTNVKDGNWTILDSRTDETNGWSTSNYKYYEFHNTTSYKAYRIRFTKINNGVFLRHLGMYEYVATTKYLIQDKNNILYSLEDGSYTKNLIPKMTSNTTPSGIASASNVCNDSDYYQPWKAFDEDKTKHQGWITNKNVLTGWLSYKFSKREIIQKYIISTGGNPQEAPASWTFEGSNDESKWVILDTQSNIVNWSPCEEKDFYFNNNRGFLYYRINISKNNGFMYVGILQLQMYSKLITLNKLGNDLTEDLFKNKGMSDPTIIQKQEVNQKEIYGVNKGSLSSGKLFEFDLNNDMKTIQNIE